MGGLGGWIKQSLCFFSEMLFDDVLFHNFWKWIMTFFFECQYKTNFLLERWGISNICSHSMHACETLWSDIRFTQHMFAWNRLCGYHELKANSIRPGCKHHETPMKSPDGSSRTCVMCPKGTKWICWGCTIDLGDVFPVCPIDIRPQCFASMHRMRTDIWSRCLIFPIKNLSCIDTQRAVMCSWKHILA